MDFISKTCFNFFIEENQIVKFFGKLGKINDMIKMHKMKCFFIL